MRKRHAGNMALATDGAEQFAVTEIHMSIHSGASGLGARRDSIRKLTPRSCRQRAAIYRNALPIW